MAKVQKAKAQKANSKQSDDFVPDEVVSSGGNSYLSLSKNDSVKIRIISKPIFGWLSWEDKTPVRTHIDDEPEVIDENNKPRKFMSVAVIDREDESVKILEMTQQSVIKAIKALAANPDWGNPFSYDITISKTGEGMKTKYTVQPSPKKPLPKDVIKAAQAKPVNLNAVFEGLNPWEVEEEQTEYFFK